MDVQEFMDMVFRAQFQTKEEWFAFRDEVYAIFDQMPKSDQEIIVDENALEMLSMIISGYEYDEERLSKLIPKGLIKFNEEQINYIKSLGLEFDFNNLSVDNIIRIGDVVAYEWAKSGYDENCNITDVGEMCESIFDIIDIEE